MRIPFLREREWGDQPAGNTAPPGGFATQSAPKRSRERQDGRTADADRNTKLHERGANATAEKAVSGQPDKIANQFKRRRTGFGRSTCLTSVIISTRRTSTKRLFLPNKSRAKSTTQHLTPCPLARCVARILLARAVTRRACFWRRSAGGTTSLRPSRRRRKCRRERESRRRCRSRAAQIAGQRTRPRQSEKQNCRD